jgi:hypothetical protein
MPNDKILPLSVVVKAKLLLMWGASEKNIISESVQCAEFPTEHLYCSKQRSTPVSYTTQQRYISEIVRKVRKKIGVSFIHTFRYSPGSEVVVFAMVTNTLVRKLLPCLEACHISQAR